MKLYELWTEHWAKTHLFRVSSPLQPVSVSRAVLVTTDYLFLQGGQASGAFRLCVNISPENK